MSAPRCYGCGTKGARGTCGGCTVAHYCSRGCQRAHGTHAAACTCVAALAASLGEAKHREAFLCAAGDALRLASAAGEETSGALVVPDDRRQERNARFLMNAAIGANRLDELPPELINYIVQFGDIRDLESLSRTNRRFADLTRGLLEARLRQFGRGAIVPGDIGRIPTAVTATRAGAMVPVSGTAQERETWAVYAAGEAHRRGMPFVAGYGVPQVARWLPYLDRLGIILYRFAHLNPASSLLEDLRKQLVAGSVPPLLLGKICAPPRKVAQAAIDGSPLPAEPGQHVRIWRQMPPAVVFVRNLITLTLEVPYNSLTRAQIQVPGVIWPLLPHLQIFRVDEVGLLPVGYDIPGRLAAFITPDIGLSPSLCALILPRVLLPDLVADVRLSPAEVKVVRAIMGLSTLGYIDILSVSKMSPTYRQPSRRSEANSDHLRGALAAATAPATNKSLSGATVYTGLPADQHYRFSVLKGDDNMFPRTSLIDPEHTDGYKNPRMGSWIKLMQYATKGTTEHDSFNIGAPMEHHTPYAVDPQRRNAVMHDNYLAQAMLPAAPRGNLLPIEWETTGAGQDRIAVFLRQDILREDLTLEQDLPGGEAVRGPLLVLPRDTFDAIWGA